MCPCFRPIDTKIVLDPSVFGLSSQTESSTGTPQPLLTSSPLHTLSTSDTDISMNSTGLDLPPPPPPSSLRNILFNMGMRETNRFEHGS
ncbi:unnamed protein product [Rotaria sp. Silwood1]|nr:unnamed protein product [Rotaria sp. Silwood1]CAF4757932.1 unnamed protein product [Rotaria sp. Silwood1]